MVKKQPNITNKSAAAELMENFIEVGKYPEMKQSEGKIKQLTDSVKKILETSESKRHVFHDFNLVGRFTAKKVYETDYISLNEYLYDIGLLLYVAEIDNKAIKTNELYMDMIEDFKLEDHFYLKPNFNKLGKELNKPSSFEILDQWGTDELAKEIALLKPKVKELTNEYEKLKRKIMRLPDIKQLLSLPKHLRKPIPHKYGSLSLVANPPKYNISAIYDYIGEWMLIEYGKPSSELLEQFMLNGTISKKEIDQFRTMVDIRLDFAVMTLEDEEKMLNMYDQKNRIAASNRLGA